MGWTAPATASMCQDEVVGASSDGAVRPITVIQENRSVQAEEPGEDPNEDDHADVEYDHLTPHPNASAMIPV